MHSHINLKNGNFRSNRPAAAARNMPAPDLARFTFAAFQGFGSSNGNSASRVALNKPRFGQAEKHAPKTPNIKAFLG